MTALVPQAELANIIKTEEKPNCCLLGLLSLLIEDGLLILLDT